MSDEEKKGANCVFSFKRGRGRGGRGGMLQRKRQNSGSSSSSEDETSVVKQKRDRKVNPMVQKSHLFKKHRTTQDEDDSDEALDHSKGLGSTAVAYQTSGKEVKNEARDNTFATRNIDTETDRDFRTLTEKADEMEKDRKGEDGEGKADDKIYRGMNNYKQYIEKKEAIQGKRIQTKGPIRAPTNIRSTVRWDYDPVTCKDYRETGICGFGDSCKFVHDRGDYKMGYQLEAEWDEAQKAKEAGEGMDSSDDDKYVIHSSDEDDMPKKCPFCRKRFTTPIITKCKHYFCERCAIEHYRKSQRCYECGKQTGGVFNPAKDLVERIRKREAAGKEVSSSEDDEKLPDESAVSVEESKPIPEDDPEYYMKVHDPYEDDKNAHTSY